MSINNKIIYLILFIIITATLLGILDNKALPQEVIVIKEEMTSKTEPEDEFIDLIMFDAESGSLLIQAKDIEIIKETDNYFNLNYEFLFSCKNFVLPEIRNIPGDGKYVEYFSIEMNEGLLVVTAHENSIAAFRINSGDDSIYIKPVHPKERYDRIILVDAGHGGKDMGTEGGGVIEKDCNLDVALNIKYIYDSIEDKDFKLYLTRAEDRYLSLEDRRRQRDDIADLFVSIHMNASERTKAAHGMNAYFYDMAGANEFRSKLFADLMLEHLEKVENTYNRGVDYGAFYVIKESKIPAVLLELGFLTNNEDAKLLSMPQHRQALANGIYNGLLDAATRINR